MHKISERYGRRIFVKMIGGTGLGLSLAPLAFTSCKRYDLKKNSLLEQDFTKVIKATGNNHNEGYIYFNGFVKLLSGVYIALAVIDQPNAATEAGVKGYQGRIILSKSNDGGASWKEINSNLDFNQRLMGAILFFHEKTLYMFVSPFANDGIISVACSNDEGITWSDWVEVIRIPRKTKPVPEASVIRSTTDDDPNWSEGQKWFAYLQHSMVVKNGHLYFSISERTQNMAIVSCDLINGLMNPESWSVSETVPVSVPRELNPGFFPGPSMGTLEGNVIEINGQLRVLARQIVDRYGTSNIAAVFDVKEDNGKPELSFTQFFPIPGAHGAFNIVYDEVSRLFWMASNLESNSQKWIKLPSGVPNDRDRRFLMLWYSLDALNWFPSGCIAAGKKSQQTFNYPSMVIDGEDLAIISRTTVDANNYTSHDADFVTFHRVSNFRSLAMNIHPVP